MTWPEVALVAIGSFQVITLTWIAAWQQRAASEVRKLNGTVQHALAANGSTAR